MFSSETYSLIDAKWSNNGSSTTGFNAQSNVSVTSDGEWVSITTSTSGEKYVLTPISFASSDNWEFSCKVNKTNSNNQAFTFVLCDENTFTLANNVYMHYSNSVNQFQMRLKGNSQSGTNNISRTLNDGDTIKVQRKNGNWFVLHNDDEILTTNYSWTGNKTLGFYTNNGRIQILKDIVIKPL